MPLLRRTPGDRIPPQRRGAYSPPARSRRPHRCAMGGPSLLPDQSKGPARRALAPSSWLRALLQRGARYDKRFHPRDLPTRRPQARSGRARARAASMKAFRLPSGGRIDRSKRLRFRFDGRSYEGFSGDTLASALIANGVHLVGRSFKYHRPRGIVGAGAEEPNALVNVARDPARATPNLRATQIELYDGLAAESQNRRPSLAFDLSSINGLMAPLIPAGFYYKTFMWPRGAWKRLYEPRIRAMAGLGRAPGEPDPDRYSQRYAHCDVLVIGAGPAGLAAALAAAESGIRVMICDEQSEPGGSLLASDATIDGKPAPDWLAETLAALTRHNVVLLTRTTAFGYFAHNMLGLAERVTDHLADPAPHLPRERLWQVRAKEVVIAAGAIERPLVFPGNDRPGIMLADAARTYALRYAARPGTRAVVVTSHDGAYRAAIALAARGVEIAAIADVRVS